MAQAAVIYAGKIASVYDMLSNRSERPAKRKTRESSEYRRTRRRWLVLRVLKQVTKPRKSSRELRC